MILEDRVRELEELLKACHLNLHKHAKEAPALVAKLAHFYNTRED
jgi:hypothetical protein